MGRPKGWASDRTGRPVMWSPGRPPVVDAAAQAGVSGVVGVRWFRESGGMPTVTQAPLSGRYLSFGEREEIAILRARECGVREIARQLGRSPSTISRELRRNAATRSGGLEYRASTAQWHADRRAQRPKPAKLAASSELRWYVQDRLSGAVERPDGAAVAGPEVGWVGRRHGRRKDRRWAKSWSPEQISHRLRLDFPDDESMRVSHEAIYLVAVCAGPRRVAAGADRLPAHGTGSAGPESPRSRPGQELRDRRDPDQRAAGGGRGPGRSRPLGRGPDHWSRELRDRHARGALEPFHDAPAPSADGRSRRSENQERSGVGRPRRYRGP